MYQEISFHHYAPTLAEVERMGIPIFNDWWSTYIPEYKEILEQKILRAYHFNEIGASTPDRFIYNINAHLEQIMPYYNKLYASELIKIDPMVNHSIKTEGRTIENLLNHVNSVDDAVSKAIRDFTGVTDKFGEDKGNVKARTVTDSTKHSQTIYDKNGNEHEDEHRGLVGTEDEKTDRLTDTNTHKIEYFNNNVNVNGTVTTDKTVTEVPDEKTVKTMDWGANETGKEVSVGKEIDDGEGTKKWTETLDDDATTDTTTNLVENTVTSSQRDYADTPQTELSADGKGNSAIRRTYLTNVTWDDTTTDHTADTVQHVDYKDDQTKVHDEETTDKLTKDKTNTTDTNKQKSGTDTETSVHTGNNVTTTHGTEATLSDTHKTGADTTDTNVKETQNTTRDLDTTEKENINRDKDWSEHGVSTTDEEGHVDTNSTSDNINTSKANSQSRERSDISKSDSKESKKSTEETTDTGSTNVTTGFMNVSSSALLEAFRRTFLNIDKMIIDELKTNFQMVY